MKILFVSPIVPSRFSSGGAIRIFKLMEFLSKRHQLYLCLILDKRPSDEELSILKSMTKTVIYELMPARINDTPLAKIIHSLKIRMRSFLNPVSGFFDGRLAGEIKALCIEEGIDIVQLEFFHTWTYLKYIPSGTRVIYSAHNIECAIGWRWLSQQNIFRFILELPFAAASTIKECIIFRRFREIIAVSDGDGRIIKKINRVAAVNIIPNGTDCAYNKFSFSDGKNKKIIFIGDMAWIANRNAVAYFLRSIFPLVLKGEKGASFLIISRTLPEEISGIIKDSGYDNVKVETGVQDVRESAASCMVSVAPFLIGGGTRLKILEAMALGVAVISTSIGCEGIECENNHNIMICDKPKDFSRAIIELMNSPQLRKRLALNARGLVETTYDWDVILKRAECLYK